MPFNVSKLLDAVIVTGPGSTFVTDAPATPGLGSDRLSFQAIIIGTGAVSATIQIEVSNDRTYWEVLHTITLSGTTSDHDGIADELPWAFVRGNVTAISGTGAAVTVNKAVVRP